MMRKHSSHARVFRITEARTPLSEDVRGRERRYVISMSVRTVCVILAVVLWNVERPLAWAALTAGLLLPYIAVVIANAGREKAPTLPSAYLVPQDHPELDRRAAPEPEAPQAADATAEPGAQSDAQSDAHSEVRFDSGPDSDSHSEGRSGPGQDGRSTAEDR